MITVEDWAEIRRLRKVEKLSERAIARRLGIHRDTVKRALRGDEPPTINGRHGSRCWNLTNLRSMPCWARITT
jgi:hypothetical protein